MSFDEQAFTEKLAKFNNSQQSIETLANWCIFHSKRSAKVVATWEREFSKAARERRVAFIYLANHIMQESRKKGPDFVTQFQRVLPKALKHVLKQADEKTDRSLRRLAVIWEERRVFGGSRLPEDLRSAFGPNGPKGAPGGDEAAGVSAAALSEDLLAESAPTRAAQAGRIPQLLEQQEKAMRTLDSYRKCVESTLTEREKVVGAMKAELRSQEELFDKTEKKLQQLSTQAEVMRKMQDKARQLQSQDGAATKEGPSGTQEDDDDLPEALLDAPADMAPSSSASMDAHDVAQNLANMENPAAVLRDALTGLSAAELNLFGSSLAQLASASAASAPAPPPTILAPPGVGGPPGHLPPGPPPSHSSAQQHIPPPPSAKLPPGMQLRNSDPFAMDHETTQKPPAGMPHPPMGAPGYPPGMPPGNLPPHMMGPPPGFA